MKVEAQWVSEQTPAPEVRNGTARDEVRPLVDRMREAPGVVLKFAFDSRVLEEYTRTGFRGYPDILFLARSVSPKGTPKEQCSYVGYAFCDQAKS